MPGIQKILHPTDFSENARYAFESACALARDNHATLIVLHVMMPSVAPTLDQPLPDPLRPADSQGAGASLPWPQAADPQIHVEHRLTEGDPAEEVLRLAALLQCDLIVVGTHGRTGLGRLLMGSVAEEVLRKAACPVLVVKAAPARPPAPQPRKPLPAPASPSKSGPAGSRSSPRKPALWCAPAALRSCAWWSGRDKKSLNIAPRATFVVQCVEGKVDFFALGQTQTLEAGKLLHLTEGEPHTIKGIAPVSVVLLTILVPGN